MIKLIDLLKEAKDKYEYGCAMLYFDFPTEIIKLQDTINPKDISTDNMGGTGIETEPHCTLLYGLHDGVTLNDVKNILDKYQFSDLKATGPSLFENEKFDVLKYDIGYPTRGGAFLHKCNKELTTLPNTQSFPDYHPHATIAYLKPGLGKKYVKLFKEKGASEFTTTPKYAIYSQPDGTKSKIKIEIV
jgi:2'-5' RNA ligase